MLVVPAVLGLPPVLKPFDPAVAAEPAAPVGFDGVPESPPPHEKASSVEQAIPSVWKSDFITGPARYAFHNALREQIDPHAKNNISHEPRN